VRLSRDINGSHRRRALVGLRPASSPADGSTPAEVARGPRYAALRRLGAAAFLVAFLGLLAVSAAACSSGPASAGGKKSVVVTYSVLGAVVKDLAGDAVDVTVLMPNGADPHEWAPSAKDIETLLRADLIVENGLNLEGGMVNAFGQAQNAGVHRFVATDHITIRHVGAGQGVSATDKDQAAGAPDPHMWMDPLTMRDVVVALTAQLKSDLGVDVSARATDLESRLTQLDAEIRATLSVVTDANRRLVTGHESLGYFADRYGFKLVGAVVPSLSDQAETSAADLAALETKIREAGVPAIFTELGTSPATARAIGNDTGARVVELTTHALPADGSYFTFLRNIAGLVAANLGPGAASVTIAPIPSSGANRLSLGPLVDPFTQNELMLRALLAGILVSLACAVVGTFVVLRGLAFIGDALAHGVLPGVAVAMLVGAPGMLGAAVGALVMIGGVTVVTQRSKLSSDSAIGLLFVGMLALGVVIVSHSASFSGDLTRILFGEIMGVAPQDLIVQAVATFAVVAASFLFYRPFLLLCFDPEQAQVSGFSARRYHSLMLLLVAMTVVVSFTSVGTLLVFGMLLAPAATGALLASRLQTMMATAVVVGVASTYLGLLISYNFDTAAGATIVMVATLVFFSALTAANVRAGLRRRSSSDSWGQE